MKPSLCAVIPVYNFANFLPETLDSIVLQSSAREIDILILDGASTDSTAVVVKKYAYYFPNIKYVRLNERGGIDRDMAASVAHASSDYVWLFSGDDWMLPGAIVKALELINGGNDLYLTRHLEWRDYEGDWVDWPTVSAESEMVFDLSDPIQRKDYFTRALTTEAFFSFIGGLIVRRATWQRVPLNERFVGSCWAHVARFFELMPTGLTVQPFFEPLVKRRPDNDSFSSDSVTKRYALTINGFTKIVDHFFGAQSHEAKEVRRVLRHEYHPLAMMLGKFLCAIDPERENGEVLDQLFKTLYGESSLECLRTRWNYARTTPARFRRWQPQLSAKYDLIKRGNPETDIKIS